MEKGVRGTGCWFIVWEISSPSLVWEMEMKPLSSHLWSAKVPLSSALVY